MNTSDCRLLLSRFIDCNHHRLFKSYHLFSALYSIQLQVLKFINHLILILSSISLISYWFICIFSKNSVKILFESLVCLAISV